MRDALTLIERLAALVPRPRVHLTTYHGVFAPAASLHPSPLLLPPTTASHLGRASELADSGAAGILNVICHRCMLGTISSALLRHLRQRIPGLPVTTLVLDGLHSTQQMTRLEAFVHQARQFAACRPPA